MSNIPAETTARKKEKVEDKVIVATKLYCSYQDESSNDEYW